MKGVHEYLSMNRGRVSRRALARLDVKRVAVAAEEMTNYLPTNLGPMYLRPGLGYIGTTDGSAATRQLPFIFASDDAAMVDVTTSSIRVRIDDVFVTRPAVTAAVANGTFTSNLTSWSDEDEGATVSAWETGGYMGLTGDGTLAARRRQTLTINQTGTEHALRIIINRGPVILRVGSSAGGDQYIEETTLEAGEHSLAFTPATSPAYIELSNREKRIALVDSIAVEGSGVMELPAPWADLSTLRTDQSGDVIFVADGEIQQRRIERRDARSWSIVKYLSLNGPFRLDNITPTTIASSGLSGNVTLTASRALFRSGHVGALFRITSVGQTVTDAFSSDNVFTNPVKVNGVEEARRFAIFITGTFVATLTLQYSFDEGATWTDFVETTFSAPASTDLEDGLNSQLIYWRIGIKSGDYTSGTATASLVYRSGSSTGVARITAYTSGTSVSAEVLVDLGNTSATETWAEGEWSDYRGWPSSVTFHEGRLWWAGRDRFWGSVTDVFDSFDPDYEGDAGPISRSIGSGPVDTVSWLVSCGRLLAGTDGSIVIPRSSSFDEPLTPTNFTPKTNATRGSARVAAVKVDDSAIYVHANGRRVIEMAIDPTRIDYAPIDLTELCPEFGEPGIIRLAVQREPDTRIHCVRSDGTVGVIVFNKTENILALCDIETDGDVEDVAVLPGDDEDSVYYVVKRTIGGSSVRYIEKFSLESECRGAAVTKLADSFVYEAGAASTITGLTHLEGEDVVAWGNGKKLGTTFTVSGGSITLPESATNRCAGLPYEARFKSTKLAYVVPQGQSALGKPKRIDGLVLVLADTHCQGVEFGSDFTNMDPLPASEEFAAVAADTIHEDYEGDAIAFGGAWNTDERLCLTSEAPKPATVMGVVIDMETGL